MKGTGTSGEIRILFQGDSITDGNRYKDPEHEWDKNHLIGHSYAFVANALLGLHFPEKNFHFINRGISGNTTLDILNRLDRDIIDINPDILSLYVGVNDGMCSEADPDGTPPEEFERRYRKILDRVTEAVPSVRIILVAPFVYPKEPQTEEHRRCMELVRQYPPVISRLSEEYNTSFIELQPLFDEKCRIKPVSYWCWDGIHPTENGHGIIAEAWIKEFCKIEKLGT